MLNSSAVVKCIHLIVEFVHDLCFPCVKWTADVETIDADSFYFFWILCVIPLLYCQSNIKKFGLYHVFFFSILMCFLSLK